MRLIDCHRRVEASERRRRRLVGAFSLAALLSPIWAPAVLDLLGAWK